MRKFGIWGCEHNHIQIFIEEMLAMGHVCVGIAEKRNTALASALGEKFRIPLLPDEGRLLQDDIEVIGSAAIHNEKIGIIERCLGSGKSIMVDKPAVTDAAGLERLRSVLRSHPGQVGMLLTERFNPAIYTLKKWIERGELGQLVSIGIRKPHRLQASRRPPWFFSKEQSGGILIDLLIHDFDLLRWLSGEEIVETDGDMGKRFFPEYPDFYDWVSLRVRMESGLTAQLYADWHTPAGSWTWGDGRICVTGTEGFAELRLAGDPLVQAGDDPLMLLVTNREGWRQTPLERQDRTITEDFLLQAEGKPSAITQSDILAASEATVAADRQVRIIRMTER